MFFKKALIFVLVAIFIFFGTVAGAGTVAGVENTRVVLLYYFNYRMLLQEFPFEPEKAVFPVYRQIPESTTLIRDTIELLIMIRDTIELLIRGELTEEEEELGFITEFPHPGFRLVDLDLTEDGTLILEFTEIFGFTTGGSARILVMREQIEKTACQFAAVKRVEYFPESLFQP